MGLKFFNFKCMRLSHDTLEPLEAPCQTPEWSPDSRSNRQNSNHALESSQSGLKLASQVGTLLASVEIGVTSALSSAASCKQLHSAATGNKRLSQTQSPKLQQFLLCATHAQRVLDRRHFLPKNGLHLQVDLVDQSAWEPLTSLSNCCLQCTCGD